MQVLPGSVLLPHYWGLGGRLAISARPDADRKLSESAG